MMKKFFKLSMLALSAILLAACSDDDESEWWENYDADTAVSSYEPSEKTKVRGIKMTNYDSQNRECIWDYEFLYDAAGRIKEINLNMKNYYRNPNTGNWYDLNVRTTAGYYYLADNRFGVRFKESREFPEYPAWNNSYEVTRNGVFNSAGLLHSFHNFECEYSGMLLTGAYTDFGNKYSFFYSMNNIKNYKCTTAEDSVYTRKGDYEYYLLAKKNNTNFDFAAFVGYLQLEIEVPELEYWYYAPYTLSAFGMFGTCAVNLPAGDWDFDSAGLPILYNHPSGFKMEIDY